MTAAPKPTVVRDPEWLTHLRTLPCHFQPQGNCNHWTTIGKGPSEVSHLDGKGRADRCVPACGGHHRTNLISWHSGQETFCRHYHTTKATLICEAESLYAAYRATR